MRLNRTMRDYYQVEIETDPPLSGTWEASFDAGTTFHDGTPAGDSWAWLVAGPDFAAVAVGMSDGDTIAVIERDLMPIVRLKENPVVVVDRAPNIDLWS